MIAHTYQHTYTPTHPMKPGYLNNAITWCERAYARHRNMPEGTDPDTVACLVGALMHIEAHRQAMYDRWMQATLANEFDGRHWSDDPRYQVHEPARPAGI